MDTPSKIGFIGLGIMGAPMPAHLLAAGYELHVYTRTRAKGDQLIGSGAHWHGNPASVAAACNTVITMVSAPQDVQQVWHGGLMDSARSDALLIDMTTSSPSLAQRLHDEGKAKGLRVLDAPVSGGQGGAKAATLAIMVGGDVADYEAALPLFEKMGRKIVHCGPAGSGQRVKLTNQVLIASNVLGLAEGLAFARKGDLDMTTVLAVIAESTGASNMLKAYGQKMVDNDWAPGFFVEHFIKDMTIALEEAEDLGLDLTSLRNSLHRFRELQRRFGGADGIQSIARLVG
jgi:3-hydroxyisobutyrate dehydrogenase